jgi:hypothetical protein
MCIFPKVPKPKPLPPPPNKLDTQVESLRRTQQGRVGGMMRSDTNVTGGSATGAQVYTPAAGGKALLGM